MDRRRFIVTGGAVVATLGVGAMLRPQAATPALAAAENMSATLVRTPLAAPAPFTRAMPVPPELKPVNVTQNYDYYQLPIQNVNAEIVTGLQTPIMSYGSAFVGPTIRTTTNRFVRLTVDNKITEPSTLHLHGGHTAAASDGHPADAINPGTSRVYEYRNQQQGAGLWYHDHAHMLEAEHNYRGLQGAYIIDDPSEKSLGLPSGTKDIPIMLRDVKLAADGALIYGDPEDRPTPVANGIAQPFFKVSASRYRFRLINGATLRIFTLSLSQQGLKFTKIGSDGGLLPAPVALDTITIGSAERADVVIDFSQVGVGKSVVLTDAQLGQVMRFDVTQPAGYGDAGPVPSKLRALPALGTATVNRSVNMTIDTSDPNNPMPGEINGKPFDINRVDFTVKLGATEIWTITSTDNLDPKLNGIRHTFHMHLVQFRVLSRTGGLLPGDAGRKDTVLIIPGQTVKVQATFSDYTGRYLYHCHFLEHSGAGMMAQMEIVA